MDKCKLDMIYNFHGSANSEIVLEFNDNGSINLWTMYNEIIATVSNGYGLMKVLKALHENAYA